MKLLIMNPSEILYYLITGPNILQHHVLTLKIIIVYLKIFLPFQCSNIFFSELLIFCSLSLEFSGDGVQLYFRLIFCPSSKFPLYQNTFQKLVIFPSSGDRIKIRNTNPLGPLAGLVPNPGFNLCCTMMKIIICFGSFGILHYLHINDKLFSVYVCVSLNSSKGEYGGTAFSGILG